MSRRYPTTSSGWYRYYERRFNKTQCPDAMCLAQLNLLFFLAFGDDCVVA